MKYFTTPFIRFLDFNGKSSVKEFWMFLIFQYMIFTILGFVEGMIGILYFGKIYLLIILIPFTALGFRRLNDAGFNRWLFLIPLVNILLASIKKNK